MLGWAPESALGVWYTTPGADLFFREKKEEVKKAMSLDFTMEQREELIREDALAEGKALTGTAYVDCIQKNLGLDLQQACAAIGISVEEYEEMKKVLSDN